MVYRAWTALLVALLVAIVGAAGSPAKAQDTLQYENGHLTARFLPFSKPFMIRGSTYTVQGSPADIVLVREIETTRLRADPPADPPAGSIRDKACWVQRKGGTDTTFKVWLSKPLVLAHGYRFYFTFANTRGAEFASSVVQSALESVALHFNTTSKAPTAGQTDSLFVDALRSTASGLLAAPVWVSVEGEATCSVSQDPRPPHFSTAALDPFFRAAQLLRADPNPALISAATARLRARSLDADLAALRTHIGNPRVVITAADADELEAAVKGADPTKLDAGAEGRFRQTFASNTPISNNDPAILGALEDLHQLATHIKNATARRSGILEVLNRSAKALPTYYIPVSAADISQESWGDTTAVRALQVGAAIGAGYAWLNPGRRSNNGDGALFAALRYYLAPVDRTLPNPWSSGLAHYGVDVGALVNSKLLYKGQSQADFAGGFTPVFGLSYDVNTHLAANGGLVFFRQPSVNQLNAKSQPVRMAPFFGLSFDTDLLNQVRKLIPSGSAP